MMLPVDELLEKGEYRELVSRQAKQVRWFYNNSNKCTNVINSTLCMLLADKLEKAELRLKNSKETNQSSVTDASKKR